MWLMSHRWEKLRWRYNSECISLKSWYIWLPQLLLTTYGLETLSFDLQGHPRWNDISLLNSEYVTSYLSAIVTMGIRSNVYEIQTRDLEFWPSRSSKVKGHLTNEFTIHDFLLVFNSNYGSTKHRLGDTDQWPWVWPSRSSMVKDHLTYEFTIDDILLVCNGNYGSTKHRLWDTDQWPWVWPSRKWSKYAKNHFSTLFKHF